MASAYDLVIRGGTIMDGSGGVPFIGDVAVSDGKIAGVGVVSGSGTEELDARGLSPEHAFDLLEAFRRDVTKLRYRDWDDLLDYCRYSAMPVGRFVLEVHGEDRALWPLNDSLCAALQVINHLQDCAKDYRELNRVYIPGDVLADVSELGHPRSSPALLKAIRSLASRNAELLARSAAFAGRIGDARLALEVDLIQTLARDLNDRLSRRDPLHQKVHHGKADVARLFAHLLPGFLWSRIWKKTPMRADR